MINQIISSYSREQALQDGLLIDVSEVAQIAGIRFPTAVTQAVWSLMIPSQGNSEDVKGRLWDTLFVLSLAAKSQRKSTLKFKVAFSGYIQIFKAVVSPGDTLEPVITIMMPNEE